MMSLMQNSDLTQRALVIQQFPEWQLPGQEWFHGRETERKAMWHKELDRITLSYVMASNFIRMYGLFIGEGRAGREGSVGGTSVNFISG